MFDFPSAPSNGQQVTAPNGAVYAWNGTSWAPVSIGLPAYAPLASPVFTGDARAVTPAYGDNDTSIPTTAFVQSAVAPTQNNAGRNLVMNGAFAVQQRGAGPWTASGNYTADRWTMGIGGSSLSVNINTLTDTDRTALGDETAQYSLGANCTGTSGAADVAYVEQHIENLRRLSGKTVTVSFWAVVASGTPKLGINIIQYFGSGGSPSATVQVTGQSVTLSTSWARYSLTFSVPSLTGKTIGSNNDGSTFLRFWLSSGATNNANAGGIGVQSFVLALWGVQLETGTQATPFDAGGTPADQLRQCERFYQTGVAIAWSYNTAGQLVGCAQPFRTTMRAAPTVAFTSPAYTNTSGIGAQNFWTNAVGVYATVTTNGSAGFSTMFTASADL